MRIINDPNTKCYLCKNTGPLFTYWPADREGCRNLLCRKCAADHLTAEGYKERFNEDHPYKLGE